MTEKIETSFNTFIDQTKAALERNAITKPEKIELAKRVVELAESGSVLDGGFAAFIAGASMNFSDEIIGELRAAVGDDDLSMLTKGINQMRQAADVEPIDEGDVATILERRAMAKYRDENPGAALGYELAGGVVTGLLVPGAAYATIPRAIGTAVASGALSGAGAADESESRTSGAVKGGTIGGLTQGALSGAGRAISGGLQSLRTGTPASSGSNIADSIVRDAMRSDSVTPASVAERIAGAGDKPMALADMGPNLQATLDVVKQLPGEAKKTATDFLRERDKSMVTRLTEDLQQAFGSRARFFPEFKSMQAKKKRLGGKLYDTATSKNVPVTNELTAILDRPSLKRAFAEAAEIGREAGYRMPKLALNDRRQLVDENGDVVTDVSTKFLHYLKLALDDQVFKDAMPVGGSGPVRASGIKQTRAKFLDYIDRNNPSYKRARDYWAGETAAQNAMTEGRKFLRADPDELADAIGFMGRSEKEAFRIGAMNALIEGVEGGVDTANLARNMIKRERSKKLIRSTFDTNEAGQRKFNKFIANLENEIDMKATSSTVLGNSATAARQAAMQQVDDRVATAMPPPSSIVDVVRSVFGRNAKNVAEQQREAAAQRLAEILTTTDYATLNRTLSAISDPQGARRVIDALKTGTPKALGRIISPVAVGGAAGGQSSSLPITIDIP